MTEAEVILRLAMYYIKNGLTQEHVTVSIDGAHVKTGNTVHFEIFASGSRVDPEQFFSGLSFSESAGI